MCHVLSSQFVLTPPILLPDYWLICPTCLSSLPFSFAPFIFSLCLQSCARINKVETWADEWGFRNSDSKSKYVVFGLRKKTLNNSLNIYISPIERVKSFKFLGVWFEERMSWKVHIDTTVKKCKKVINTLRFS